ncbi:MAG: MgtC/SapB family protein [Candidatus Binataceae bacterium]
MFAFFPYDQVALKIALALGAGLLVGLEREWAQKDVGVRTFAIVCLFGALTVLTAPGLMVVAMAGTFLLLAFLNLQSFFRNGTLELTTSAALLVVLVGGALIGQGHYFTAVTAIILMTLLLAWKAELARFAGGLQPDEIRSAVLLGLLSFVICPLLPNRFVDPWQLLNPRQDWIIVIVIAGLGFSNYIMLRFYGTRGIYYTAFLGGLVNSTATAAEVSSLFRGTGDCAATIVAVIMLTSVAMFLRNLVILAIFGSAAVGTALIPLAVMTVAALVVLWLHWARGDLPMPQLRLSSPVSLPHVLRFAAMFIALMAAGTLAQRYFGSLGFLVLCAVGGLVSSASATATAAALAASGKITPDVAGIAVVLASMASALADLPLVYQQTRQPSALRRLAGVSTVILLLGAITLVFGQAESRAIQSAVINATQSLGR